MYKTLKYIQRKSLLDLFISASLLLFITAGTLGRSIDRTNYSYSDQPIVIQQVAFDPNNISTWLFNTGIFNQDLRSPNTPGFEWPKGTGKFAVFTTGLCVGAYVNNQLREAMGSYKGEYAPGYVAIVSGLPVAMTNSDFKIYKVKRGDNMYNNPDWLNWGLMVPYGAPYIDVNHNGVYEPAIDTPGIRGAVQTLFACLTDGFPEEHKIGEGFGGGTLPLFVETHWTAWGYDNPGLENMQFLKWDIINKNTVCWDSVYMAVVADPDIGYPNDDYIGCDTARNMGYCYNASNMDGDGSGITYGADPPAVGFALLNCGRQNISLSSLTYFTNTSIEGPICEKDPNGQPLQAFYMLQGIKNDRTPWVIPNTTPPRTTKFCYSGDPESGTGWTEYGGQIQNCGGYLTGPYVVPVQPGDRRLILASHPPNYIMNPGDTEKVVIAQLIARGTSNKNSVTKLKQMGDVAQQLCNNGFVMGIENVSSNVPKEFALYQNYPNPFNPSTKIQFQIPLNKGGGFSRGLFTRLTIYDILGREVTTLINEQLQPGTYEVEWDGTNRPSGVYYYKLSVSNGMGDYYDTKKMVLIK